MMTGYRVALIDLVSTGQVDLVRDLIAKGCDVDEKDDMGGCAVMTAIKRNDLAMLKVLVDEGGAELDVKDHMERPALSRARQLKHDEMAEWIEKKLAQQKLAKPSSQEPKAIKTIPSVNAPGVFSKPQEKDEDKDNQQTISINHRR